ncbi:MAG: hypothetical protein WCJ81_01635 [bacterium]
MITNSLDTILQTPEKKLITIRHFHSTAQEFASKVWEMQQAGKCKDEYSIKQLKNEYSKNI